MNLELTPNIFEAYLKNPDLFSDQQPGFKSEFVAAVRDLVFEYADLTEEGRQRHTASAQRRGLRTNHELCTDLIETHPIFILQFVKNPGGSITVFRKPVSQLAKNYTFPMTRAQGNTLNVIDAGRVSPYTVDLIRPVISAKWLAAGGDSITIQPDDLVDENFPF